jgi:hypothetical protein
MKSNNIIILAGAALAWLAYAVGKRNGHNECLCKRQSALLKAIVNDKKDKKDEP